MNTIRHLQRTAMMKKKGGSDGYVFTDPSTWTQVNSIDLTGIANDPSSLKYCEGTNKLFIKSYNDIQRFSLPSDGDITGLTLDHTKAIGLSSCNDFCFSPDGTLLFVTNQANPPYLNKFTVSVPFDLSSTVTLVQQKAYSYWGSRPGGIHFRPDGKRFMIATYDSNTSQERYRQFSCATAWDIENNVTHDFAETSILYLSFCFTPNGRQFIDWYPNGQDCYLHNLQSPWVIENEVSAKTDFPALGYPTATTFWENGLYAYTCNPITKVIYQHSTDAAPYVP